MGFTSMTSMIENHVLASIGGLDRRPRRGAVTAQTQRLARCRLCLFAAVALLTLCSAGPAFAETASPSDALGPGNVTGAADSPTAAPLRVVYFHSPTCDDCREVKRALPGILRRWGSKIRLVPRTIEDIDVFNELFLYEQHYGAKVDAPPVVFAGSQYLCGATAIINRFDNVIAGELAKGSAIFSPPAANGHSGHGVPWRRLGNHGQHAAQATGACELRYGCAVRGLGISGSHHGLTRAALHFADL